MWERGVQELCGSLACLDLAVTGFCVNLSAKGLHSASIPGILALDLCPSDTNKILTGESGPVRGGRSKGGASPDPLHGFEDRKTFFGTGIL